MRESINRTASDTVRPIAANTASASCLRRSSTRARTTARSIWAHLDVFLGTKRIARASYPVKAVDIARAGSRGRPLSRDSPDESQTGINVRVSPALLQDRREVLTATSTSGPRLTRYMRRWLVERFFAWIQWQRQILVRWEYHTQNFLGFVQLACLVILFTRILDT